MKRLISMLIAVIILTPIAIIGNIPVGFVPKEESSPSRELMPDQSVININNINPISPTIHWIFRDMANIIKLKSLWC